MFIGALVRVWVRIELLRSRFVRADVNNDPGSLRT